jgi:hypothetical protein
VFLLPPTPNFVEERYYLSYLQNSWVLVAHACNPSYSEGRDQEDCCLKPDQTNSLRAPSQKKKKNHKKGLAEWLKV